MTTIYKIIMDCIIGNDNDKFQYIKQSKIINNQPKKKVVWFMGDNKLA